jgi:hypothetical protein
MEKTFRCPKCAGTLSIYKSETGCYDEDEWIIECSGSCADEGGFKTRKDAVTYITLCEKLMRVRNRALQTTSRLFETHRRTYTDKEDYEGAEAFDLVRTDFLVELSKALDETIEKVLKEE